MSEARKKADWPSVATLVAALILVPLGLYLWGYFAMSTGRAISQARGASSYLTIRHYDAAWKASFYYPAAKAESILRGRGVVTTFDPPDDAR